MKATLSQIKRSSEFVMLTESVTFFQGHHSQLISPRHGSRNANGIDAATNIAFFDGHVAPFDNSRFQDRNQMEAMNQEAIFFFGKQ